MGSNYIAENARNAEVKRLERERRQMKATKRLMMLATLGVAGLIAIPASAQWNPWGHDHDRDRDGYGQGTYSGSQNSAYEQGYKDGIWDREHGPQERSRNWRNDGDAAAYRDGYNSGYRGGNGGYSDGRWGTWGDHDRYPNGGYGGGYNRDGVERARQMGYQDGMYEGSKDAQTGHSYRPTASGAYKDANHGQSVSGISGSDYKQIYRDAYMRGYEQGYGGRGGYGRRH
jgi:ribosome modulation factor